MISSYAEASTFAKASVDKTADKWWQDNFSVGSAALREIVVETVNLPPSASICGQQQWAE